MIKNYNMDQRFGQVNLIEKFILYDLIEKFIYKVMGYYLRTILNARDRAGRKK